MNQAVMDFSHMEGREVSSFPDQIPLDYRRSLGSGKGIKDVVVATDTHLNVRELAIYLHCSVSTVERLTKEGVIPSFKVGRLRRYNKHEVLMTLRGRGG